MQLDYRPCDEPGTSDSAQAELQIQFAIAEQRLGLTARA
jgi:hypothetical protein